MLRRNPTALTISSEDINAFEQAHAHAQAYKSYLKTGHDPSRQFAHLHQRQHQQQQQHQRQRQHPQNQNQIPRQNTSSTHTTTTTTTTTTPRIPSVQEEFDRAHARFHLRMAQNHPSGMGIGTENVNANTDDSDNNNDDNNGYEHGRHHEAGMTGRPSAPDPNDELKPLPGDKARIIRSREERIMGVGGGGGASGGNSGGGGAGASAGMGNR